MERTQPDYLAKLPRDRLSIVWVVCIGLVLGGTIFAAWQIYIGTVIGWERRFNAPSAPAVSVTREMPRESVLAEERLRALIAARQRQPEVKVDRCIDGVAFRKLPEGGWENLPNESCQ